MAEVLLADEEADQARALLPPEMLRRPAIDRARVDNPRPGMRLPHGAAVFGIVVRSPISGVTGRRWWTVARTALQNGHDIDAALHSEPFVALEQSLGLEDHFQRCDVCGDDITPRGLRGHQRRNSACRFLSDIAEVRTLWDLGYRDPFSLRDAGVPITWTELNSRVRWRNRVHIVRSRLWTAVLYREAMT